MTTHKSVLNPPQRARIGVAASVLLLTAACGGGGGEADDGSGPIKVGSILDETGPLNIYGTAMADA
ncbi:MAG: hypothetical protein M3440_02210, partial [Chloroflexota bacterium]|nr:hypothetical protein [Chloroflexota bacterium]